MSDPIDAEVIRDVSWLLDIAVSPSGETVAYVVKEFDGEEDEAHTSIFTVPTDGSESPHRLTRTSGASSPRWSPDGETLAFLASREEDVDRRTGRDESDEADEGDDEEESGDAPNGGGDDVPKTQVWAFDLDRGGDAIQLTDRDHGVREFDWGPRGERIVMAARDPTDEQEEYLDQREEDGPIEIERLQHKADGRGYTDDVTTYLFVVDLETGDEGRLDEAHGAGALEPTAGLQPSWHPNANEVAFVRSTADRPDDSLVSNVFTVDVESGDANQITETDYSLSRPRWSPDGDRLVTSGSPADNLYHPGDVFLVDRTTATVERLTDGFEPTLAWTGTARFLDDDTILVAFGDEGWTRPYRIDVDGGEPEPCHVGLTRDQSVRHVDAGNDTVVLSVTDPARGNALSAIAADSLDEAGKTRLVEFHGSIVDEYPMPRVHRIETATDDATIESIIYAPESFDPSDPEPHPVLLWTHGGPMAYDDPQFRFASAYFISRGYVICKPNYRGSTSYGLDFADALRGQWGSVEVDDVLAVTDAIVDRGIADPDRLFAIGLSYGGILTGYLVTRTDRYTAAAAEHGIYDLRSDFGSGDTQASIANEFGLPWEDPETYDAASSILDVGNVDTPTLVTAGQQDWRCPPHQSEQFYVSLRKQGVPAKLVIYPNEHHNVGNPERAIHRLETIADWFETHDPTVADDDSD